MAGDRTLKLSILADVSNLGKQLNAGSKEIEGFGTQVANISEKAVKAFAAIGVAVGAVSLAFAKAAAEDEAAANKLASTIGAVTGATEKQIAAVEQFITKTALATGVTDDQLRPAYERLVRSTQSVEEATKLLNLALDLSAATGRPLEQIAQALGKAYDGNTTALGRLGLGLDAGLIKSKDFNAIYQTLNKTFGEFSEKRSEEAIVKFQRLQVALDEAKEQIGAALLPAFEQLGDWLINEGVPRLNAFIAGLTGDKSLSASFTATQKASERFGEKVRGVINLFIEYKDVVIAAAALTASVFVISKIAAGVTATIALIRSLIMAYNALKAAAVTASVATAFAMNPLLGIGAGTAVFAALGLAAKKLSDMDNANLPTAPTYNDQVVAAIQSRSLQGGAATGGGSNAAVFTGASTGVTKAAETAVAASKAITEMPTLGNARVAGIGGISGPGLSMDPDMVAPRVTINVNSPSVIDQNGFTAAVVDAFNQVQARTGGGASRLVAL